MAGRRRWERRGCVARELVFEMRGGRGSEQSTVFRIADQIEARFGPVNFLVSFFDKSEVPCMCKICVFV